MERMGLSRGVWRDFAGGRARRTSFCLRERETRDEYPKKTRVEEKKKEKQMSKQDPKNGTHAPLSTP